jgi:hypothetical protein
MNAQSFKSPRHKLLTFFQRSRDLWRARANQYHREIRSLEIRIRDLEASRAHWRERYFAGRSVPAAVLAPRGHEPPPAGAIARPSSPPSLRL